MRPQRNANYCCQCGEVFMSIHPYPDECSMCRSPKWNQLKKYPDHDFDYQEDDEFLASQD